MAIRPMSDCVRRYGRVAGLRRRGFKVAEPDQFGIADKQGEHNRAYYVLALACT